MKATSTTRAGILVCYFLLFILAPAAAPGQDTTCDILARGMQQDVLIRGSDSERFETFQQAICRETYRSFEQSKSSTLDGSLTVVGYVDGALNKKSDSSSWSVNWTKFCGSTYYQLNTSVSFRETMRSASLVAYNAIVRCVEIYANQSGLFGLLAIQERYEGFQVAVHHRTEGESAYRINGIAVTPVTANVRCNDSIHDATPSNPITIRTAKFVIACDKDPSISALVSIQTSVGVLSYRIPALNDSLSLLNQRISELESSSVPSGTIAFFNLQNCPTGWDEAVQLRGRYVVGAHSADVVGKEVGESLGPSENRATGAHTHPYNDTYHGGNVPKGVDWGPGADRVTAKKTTGNPAGAKPGTNAPYIQYRACVRL